MKYFLFLFSIIFSASFIQAQDSWKICVNKKTVLISSESNEVLNSKKINPADWNKNGYLKITYKEKTPSTWLHSLQFTDELGNQLLVKDSSTTAKIPIAVLRKLFAGKKELKIYMIISPSNPLMMAPSRMKHLLTLELP